MLKKWKIKNIKEDFTELLYEECNSDTLWKFMKEYKSGEILPLRLIKLCSYFAKLDCFCELNQEYRDLTYDYMENGIVKVPEGYKLEDFKKKC